MSDSAAMQVGVLTISDSRSRGHNRDEGGPAIRDWALRQGWSVERQAVVPDETVRIARLLRQWCDKDRLDVIFTTGGTGLGPRDVTPEATCTVLEREVPGIAETLRSNGLRHTPRAALSRGLCAVRGRTLIINLPGSPRSLRQSFPLLAEIVPHARYMMAGKGHGHRSA